ncbi:MAG: L-2-amino-thiazoline-4-carboxylic acid hydrolase [Firmicutes bacterium]|nr:L-2-amino-thiazoline-4-carboxylic acid hydrolase [Bacillota bacterium]
MIIWNAAFASCAGTRGCPELAKYLCQLDFVLADIMGMKLERTMTLAEGDPKCDFRYSKK